jgi:tripartite-type tricarboxylate transporter receptor subunit TctC
MTKGLVILMSVPGILLAQPYPSKPVHLVTPFPPGGAVDLTARLMQQRLSVALGQSVVIDNRAGASGRIGATFVSKAPADGYTMLFTVGSDLAMRQGMPGGLNLLTDLTPVATAVASVSAIAVRNDLGVNSLRELMDLVKRNPGKLSYGSAGIGSAHHLTGERLKQLGYDLIHVPYKGLGPALSALVSGEVDINVTNVATALPQARAGKVKIVAVIQPSRFDGLPDVPTVREVLPGFDVPVAWYAFFGPPGLPRPIVDRWNGEIAKALEAQDIRQRLTDSSMALMTTPTDQMPALVRTTAEVFDRLFKSTGITLEE